MKFFYDNESSTTKNICDDQTNLLAKYICPAMAFFKGLSDRRLTLNTWETTRYGLRGALYCQTVIFIDGNVNLSINEELLKKDSALIGEYLKKHHKKMENIILYLEKINNLLNIVASVLSLVGVIKYIDIFIQHPIYLLFAIVIIAGLFSILGLIKYMLKRAIGKHIVKLT